MIDMRVEEAQRLFWEVQALRSLRAPQASIASKLSCMAILHEERARELLSGMRPDGWTDLFAAISAWGEAGSDRRARSLLQEGARWLATFEGRATLQDELDQLRSWLDGLRVVPALEDFARPTPPFEREAA